MDMTAQNEALPEVSIVDGDQASTDKVNVIDRAVRGYIDGFERGFIYQCSRGADRHGPRAN